MDIQGYCFWETCLILFIYPYLEGAGENYYFFVYSFLFSILLFAEHFTILGLGDN